MYTTKTAGREKALKAVAATLRAMERHACCKSQFKFKCFSCGEMINRGDKITRCHKKNTGMTLRYRGADATNGLTMDETAFYQGATGNNMWVHIGCQPCYWDKGFDNGYESSPPGLRVVPTEWGCKIDREWEDWTSGPGGEAWLTMGVPYFLKIKGYPKEKSMRARIVRAVTRFQALWRGYVYKKAYPIARLDAIATKLLNDAGLATLSGQEVPDLITKRQREAKLNSQARNRFLHNNSLGGHIEILFDEGLTSAAIYSANIVNHTKRDLIASNDLYFWVTFHHDGEVRKYHWKKLRALKLECKTFKSKHGIMTKITGKLPLYIL